MISHPLNKFKIMFRIVYYIENNVIVKKEYELKLWIN